MSQQTSALNLALRLDLFITQAPQDVDLLVNQWCLGWGRDSAPIVSMGTEEAYPAKAIDLGQWNCCCSVIWATGGRQDIVDALDPRSAHPEQPIENDAQAIPHPTADCTRPGASWLEETMGAAGSTHMEASCRGHSRARSVAAVARAERREFGRTYVPDRGQRLSSEACRGGPRINR